MTDTIARVVCAKWLCVTCLGWRFGIGSNKWKRPRSGPTLKGVVASCRDGIGMKRPVNAALCVVMSLAAFAHLPGCNQTRDVLRDMTIHEAAAGGYIETAALLLDRGADVNAKNERGWTPLHLAVRRGYTETAALLLDRGADVNAQDKDGETPLHWATVLGHTDTAELLRSRGGVE